MRAAGLLLVALAAGCGGGDSSSTPPAARTLQLFGDSTQHEAAPFYRRRLGARLVDSSVAGTRSGDLISGTTSDPRPWPAPVVGDLVLVNHALNDSAVAAHVELEAYRANLRRLADAPGLVLFETPNPVTDPIRNPAPYVQVMREVAAERGVRLVDVYGCLTARADWPTLIRDGTHPSDAGYAYIVDTCVLPQLADLLGVAPSP